MNSIPTFNSYSEKSIIKNWHLDALTDYKGATLQYHDVARKIEKLHILFENSDVKKGDKIAVCGRNSSQWAVAFLAIITYGAIVVPIQNEFKPEQIHNIVNHSESKLLFVGDVVATEITPDEMPSLEGIIYLPDNSLVISRTEKLTYAREHLNQIFCKRYPKYFRPEHIHYHVDDPEELAMINYTSGTTGFSKGVMLPYRALWGNLDYMLTRIAPKIGQHCNILASLPMAHMYGLMADLIFNMALGNHIYFLTRLPSPTLIAQAFTEIKPDIIFAVPLVVEKIVRKKIFPLVQTNRARLLMNMPVINKRIKEKIREFVLKEFGGNAYEVVVGGAPLNKEIENFFISIGFPIGDGSFHHLRQRGGLCGRQLRRSREAHGGESTQQRPSECARRIGLPRHQHHEGILQERGGHQGSARQGRMVPHRRLGDHERRWSFLRQGTQQEHAARTKRTEHLS